MLKMVKQAFHSNVFKIHKKIGKAHLCPKHIYKKVFDLWEGKDLTATPPLEISP